MYPEIDLGPVTIQTFGLMFAFAFIVSGAIVARRLKEFGAPADWSYEMTIAAGVGGLLGAKLWYAVEAGEWSADQLLSGSGLVWYGGALGGAFGVTLYARYRGILNANLPDLASPALAAGYAVGRIGCQLSGDGDYGKVTNSWIGMGYPDGSVPTPPGVEVYPTPVFETLGMFAAAALLWWLRDRFRPGVLFGVYLVLAGVERFLVEFVRRNDEFVAGLTLAQVMSVAMIAGGLAVILSFKDRPAPAERGLLPAATA